MLFALANLQYSLSFGGLDAKQSLTSGASAPGPHRPQKRDQSSQQQFVEDPKQDRKRICVTSVRVKTGSVKVKNAIHQIQQDTPASSRTTPSGSSKSDTTLNVGSTAALDDSFPGEFATAQFATGQSEVLGESLPKKRPRQINTTAVSCHCLPNYLTNSSSTIPLVVEARWMVFPSRCISQRAHPARRARIQRRRNKLYQMPLSRGYLPLLQLLQSFHSLLQRLPPSSTCKPTVPPCTSESIVHFDVVASLAYLMIRFGTDNFSTTYHFNSWDYASSSDMMDPHVLFPNRVQSIS